MSKPAELSGDDVKRLIRAEFRAATCIPLEEAIAPFLVEPFVRMLAWPYAQEREEYPCWIVADLSLHAAGLTLAHSEFGHGWHGDAWASSWRTNSGSVPTTPGLPASRTRSSAPVRGHTTCRVNTKYAERGWQDAFGAFATSAVVSVNRHRARPEMTDSRPSVNCCDNV